MTTPIEILRGDRARQLLSEDHFLAEWSALCNTCPWATPFQSPDLAATWYRVYRDRAEPTSN